MDSTHTNRFVDKNILVTGGAQGIGRAIATAFYDEGANLLLADLNKDKIETTANEISTRGNNQVRFTGCDVRSEDSVRSAFGYLMSELGHIDILINNAGTITMRKTADLTVEDWDSNMDVNAKGTFLCTREAIPLMLELGGGVIVNTASQAGKRGYPLFSHYCASKAAVINFSRAVAVEYAPKIRINCVCPGIVNTDMMEREYAWEEAMTGEPKEAIRTRWMSGIPMGRFQEPEDVAGVVLFLASEAASEMTGQAINVTGGMVTD
jgi:meso-butanediol dehydrogenase/(S,S)-butanediol dehydrogenase/diacetyl reductase